jgi:cell division protein FtsI (penicillin-binding protein 3)
VSCEPHGQGPRARRRTLRARVDSSPRHRLPSGTGCAETHVNLRPRLNVPASSTKPPAAVKTPAAVKAPPTNVAARLSFVMMMLALGGTALIVRAVDLQVVRKDFYQDQGDQRFVRDKVIPVSRGMITDRNGEPLAVSTPVVSIWANPGVVLAARERLPELARTLGIDTELLEQRLTQRADREFVYLRRHLPPDDAQRILDLQFHGVNAQREFRRYYPSGEMAAHVLGFTNIDDRGQEGLELAFDAWLTGAPGVKRVIQNRRGDVVENVELIKEPQPGHDLRLSIDRRIQYLAYRELKAAMALHHASSGSVVIVDVPTGEILAMVNWPSYNPNSRAGDTNARRNRAVTDVFEPGSVMKAFTVAAGIESGKFNDRTMIDTNPGTLLVANHVVHDTRNHGVVDLTHLLSTSSNVGAAKIAAQLSNDHLYDMFHRFGFGQATGCGFTGESPGVLPAARGWGQVEKATLSYGYGLSATPLQLAAAYAALGNGGRLRTPTFVAGSTSSDNAVLDPDIARSVVRMLETVISTGTGRKAAVANYSVAGKTGTSRKSVPGGYQKRYVSVFAGLVPATAPRLAGVVVINDPQGKVYYAGDVAAPAFGAVMTGALRLLDVPPDQLDQLMASATPPVDLIAAPAIALTPEESPFAEGVEP